MAGGLRNLAGGLCNLAGGFCKMDGGYVIFTGYLNEIKKGHSMECPYKMFFHLVS